MQIADQIETTATDYADFTDFSKICVIRVIRGNSSLTVSSFAGADVDGSSIHLATVKARMTDIEAQFGTLKEAMIRESMEKRTL